jgi:dihydrofolate synthase/folylpolyglutamate synthase
MDPAQLKEMAMKHQLTGECFDNVNEAIEQFKARATDEDLILVCGSIFVVGEVDRKRFLTN